MIVFTWGCGSPICFTDWTIHASAGALIHRQETICWIPILVPRTTILLTCGRDRELWPDSTFWACAECSFHILSQSDLPDLTGSPRIADFRCWTKPELSIPAAGQKDRGSGDENVGFPQRLNKLSSFYRHKSFVIYWASVKHRRHCLQVEFRRNHYFFFTFRSW